MEVPLFVDARVEGAAVPPLPRPPRAHTLDIVESESKGTVSNVHEEDIVAVERCSQRPL